MNKYDDDYYILQRDRDSSQYYLSPTKNTMNRHYKFKEQFASDGPLKFESSTKGKDLELGRARSFKGTLFDGLSILLNEKYIPLFSDILPDGFKFVPSVVEANDGTWNEGYQLLNIYKTIDCLDSQASNISDEDDDGYYEVEKYALKEDVLDKIPIKDRLIMKIARINIPYTIFHKSIVDIFETNNIDGVRFFKLSEFTEGDQYL